MKMEHILQEIQGKSTWEISVGYYITLVVGGYLSIFCVAEFIAYISLFHHLYKHNENMTTFNKDDLNINTELSKKAMNKRHKKNIISFVGQFGTFMIEILAMIILTILQIKVIQVFFKQYLGLWPQDLLFIAAYVFKALNTVTFIVASPELRRYFIEKIFKL